MAIAQDVLNRNSFWAHPESLTIAILLDDRKDVRQKAIHWIKRARQEFDKWTHPRQFIPPSVRFEVKIYK